MNVIKTKAPISIDDLKIYFQDKSTFYNISYEESQLKNDILLTYLGNIELPCDIFFENEENLLELTKSYLHFKQIINVPSLEMKVIDLLFQMKGLIETVNKDFIEENYDILEAWAKKLDSLTLFNMWMIDCPEFKEYVEQFPKNETDSLEGINFVSLLKYDVFYEFYALVDESKLEYYSCYFNDYMFKGNNMYHYWSSESNPMFLLTWAIAAGEFSNEAYIAAVKEDSKEFMNVSSD
jgi:hypothetical protein